MTVHQPDTLLKEKARTVDLATVLPPLAPARNRGERVFDLHPAVHLMVAGAYLAFVAILATAFMAADLVVPAGIFVIGVIALFVTPALWARVKAEQDSLPRQSWAEFKDEGVDCCTGRLTAGQAMAQILVLPALLVSLALVMTVISAFV